VDLLGVLADLVRVLDAGSDQVLHALECVQLGEWFVQVVAGDGVFLDQEFDEDCLVESPALVVGAAFVEFLGVREELEAPLDEGDAVSEVFGDGLHSLAQLFSLRGDAAEPLADVVPWDGPVGGEVDEVGFFDAEALELGGELFLSSRAEPSLSARRS
jgi:hypothetical protein